MGTCHRHLSMLSLIASAITCSATVAGDDASALPELLKEYQALGLPLPPDTAKLVRHQSSGGGIIDGKVQPVKYWLAFLLTPATKGDPPVLLLGAKQWRREWNPEPVEVKGEPDAAKDIDLGPDDALALAIQCHARGWKELALRLMAESRSENETSYSKRLTTLAWSYWEDRIAHPTADRGPVAKRLKELMKKDADLNTEYHHSLVESLDLALVPSKSKAGSVDALIDSLVDYHANSGTLGADKPEAAYGKIVELGFDAVPALIEHLDDMRLTRAMMNGFNNFHPWHLRVRDLVGDLLEGLAAEPLMRGENGEDVGADWLRRQQGWPVTKAAASKWWEKAQKVGEEAYLLAHILPPRSEKKKDVFVNSHLLQVIVAKYPKQLPVLYRTVVEKRPDLVSWPLAEALAKSAEPAKDKLELFLAAVKHEEGELRLPALRAIKDLDKKRFDQLLIGMIEQFPKDTATAYWLSTEAAVAHLAIESDDPKVWEVFGRSAKRAALGLRMELLNQLGDRKDKRWRTERLQLLAAYLNDDEVRDNKSDERLSGPGAGFPYDRIEVRDFVAIKLGWLLGVDVELKLDRTPQEWAKVREDVRTAVKRDLSK